MFGSPRNQQISYGCTALRGTGKRGILKPDADGYYTIPVGGLDMCNASGAFYPLEPAKQLFDSSSALMRRIANGCLKGETGHPRKAPGMSIRDYMSRIMDIYEPNVCCHFRRLWLDHQNVKDRSGRPIVAIMAELKPAGPNGPALKAALDNPSENVCFSIRSLTNDSVYGGRLNKHLKTIVTFDWVTEGGIHTADRWHSPSLESYVDEGIAPMQLLAMRDAQVSRGMGLESHSSGLNLDEVIQSLGIEQLTEKPPASLTW